MPITTEKTLVARCDAPSCKAARIGTDGEPPVGFYVEIERVEDGPDGITGEKLKIYVCSTPHISKALNAKLGDSDNTTVNYPEQKTSG